MPGKFLKSGSNIGYLQNNPLLENGKIQYQPTMKNNRYYLVIVIRIFLITLNSMVLTWFYMETQKPATTLFIFLLLIAQTFSLILYLNRINRDLANFLTYLQENDTSLIFSRYRVEKNFKSIMTSLNDINRKIQDARISKEEKHQYLQAVMEHMDTAIFTCNSAGKIQFSNKAAMQLFGLTSLNHIDNIFLKYPVLKEVITSQNINSGNTIQLKTEGKTSHLSIKVSQLKIGSEQIRIISCLDIKPELERQELDSWKKLIRVLRHEIMNSITPITTLTTAIKRSFSFQNKIKPSAKITQENIEDTLTSAEVIEERSKGIISFVEKFKSITDLPEPVLKEFSIENLFEEVRLLFQSNLKENHIELEIETENPDLKLTADEHLMEQVLINLVKNSIEAIETSGKITLKAFRKTPDTICIHVIDNGKGIPPEDLENIFVPSYSTKEFGMGIGLSISRQIVQLHHGQITVQSSTNMATTFEIIFNNGG